jgi:hypothetical protein
MKKRKAGRPKLPSRIQLTVKVEKETKRKLIKEALRRQRVEDQSFVKPITRGAGSIIDWLVEKYL